MYLLFLILRNVYGFWQIDIRRRLELSGSGGAVKIVKRKAVALGY